MGYKEIFEYQADHSWIEEQKKEIFDVLIADIDFKDWEERMTARSMYLIRGSIRKALERGYREGVLVGVKKMIHKYPKLKKKIFKE